MMKHTSWSLFLILFLLIQLPGRLLSQEKSVLVERCKALDQTSPIHNIWVDADNIKWVANGNGLNKVLALDVVEKVSIPAGTTSLLSIRGGNAQIEWSTSQMQQMIGDVNITCASYDAKSKSVWIGTSESGAYQISISPFKIIQRLNVDNRRLTSDKINDIFIHTNGTIYIATDDGMLTGSGDKWTLQERYLNFIGVDAWGDNLWILGDDFLWQVDNRGKWSPIAIDLKNVEGQMRDITVDDEGRVWIASNMMTGYDVSAEKYQRFGPGQYFTSQFVNCLDVDHDGSIWTGTNDKGLYLIQWESSLILTIGTDTPLDCNSTLPTAALSVKVAGGKPPYNYTWSNGQTTQKITQVGAGDYTVTVTDASGLSKTGKYNVPDPNLTLTVAQLKPSSGKPEGDASAMASVKGGSGQYRYTWDNGEVTESAVKLSAGAHTVTVSDKSGCSAVSTITISEILEPLAVMIAVLDNNKCSDSRNAQLQAEAKGGKAPYKYAWSLPNESEAMISSLSGGTYSLTVTDAAGKSAVSSAVLPLPSAIIATPELILPAGVNTSNGQAQVKASGGKSPYTFKWDNGETTPSVKNLNAGVHTITVTDANGCIASVTINVSENITAMNGTIRQKTEIKCHDGSTGALMAEVTGGKGPYVYHWNTGQKTQELTNLKAGNYQVTITDVVGAIVTANATVSEPAAITVSIMSDGAASTNGSDGKATAKATGGTGTYEFAWDSGEKTSKALKLKAGTHQVTVSDANGCSAIGSVEISENILALQISVEQTSEIKCAGAQDANLKANVTGGKQPYTFQWNASQASAALSELKEGLYTLTVTDAMGHTATTVVTIDAPPALTIKITPESAAATNASNGRANVVVSGGKEKYSYLWDNGEKTSRAEKLSAGNHTVTVTDNNGCTITGTVAISENILPLNLVIHQEDVIACAGQASASLSADIKGGKEPYTYTWKGSQNEWSTPQVKNLGAGTYTLQVKDAAGTLISESFEVKEPMPLKVQVAEISPASTGNADGQLTLKVSGGKTPYSYNGVAWGSSVASYEVSKLGPGVHKMVITDASGCSAEVNATITEDILPLSVSIRQTNAVLCAGASQGSLDASVKGGKAPYSYSWSTGKEGSSLTNVAPGNYTLIVTDATGLKSSAEFKVTAPAPIEVQIVNLRSATNDRISDGKGGLEIKGGTGPYTYQWTSGETTSQASKLPLGNGEVIVTDQNGCSSRAQFLVKEKVLAELTAERLASGEPIRMEKIQFQADSVNIESEALPSLDELYEFLYDNPTTIIEVAGHTNGLPADDYCDRISGERAKSVADYLINKGIESRRVISKGYGKRKPVATNQTPEGRKRNQRVEIRLIKIEE